MPNPAYPQHERSSAYVVLSFLVGLGLLLMAAVGTFAAGAPFFFCAAIYVGFAVVIFRAALRAEWNREAQDAIYQQGIELEAEVLAHYEAGALLGSDLAKMRQMMIGSEDPLELELRYAWDGQEILSRRRVSSQVFFHTRGMKTLKIKVLPDQPEDWIAIL